MGLCVNIVGGENWKEIGQDHDHKILQSFFSLNEILSGHSWHGAR